MDLTRDSIDEMRRKIEQSIVNGKIIITDLDKKGVLSLETIQLLKVVNDGNPLEMEGTKISSTSDKVLLEGLINFLNDERLGATVSFYIINDQAELVVDIKLPDDWLIRDAYPYLPHSRIDREDNTGRRESYFYDIRLDKARFLFTSYTHQYKPIKENLERGLSLFGKLKFHGITEWLKEYVESQITPTIFGLVDNGAQNAKMTLRSNLSTLTMPSIPLEDSQLKFEGKIRSTSNELTKVWISGNIKVPDVLDNKKIPLSGELTQEGLNPLQLLKDNLSTPISDLKRLEPIVGDKDLEKILPQGLKHPDRLRINKIEILLHVQKKAITLVNIVVSTDKNWIIFDGKFVVRQVQFEFNVISPFSQERSVSGLVKGVTGLDNQVRLDITSEIPPGTLIKGSRTGGVSLKEIARQFIGRSYDVPDLNCSEFYIEIDESQDKQEFNLRANTDEEWEIPFGITTVKVQRVRLDIGGSFSGEKEAIIGGEVSIENNLFEINQNVKGDGRFFGSSSVESFSLRSLLEKLCGSHIYPAALPNLALERMSFEIASQKNGSFFQLESSVKNFGEIQLFVGKYHQNQWNFMAALTLKEEWDLSDISDEFKKLDFLQFTNAMLIISSFTNPDIIIPGDSSGTKGIEKGLTFRAQLHMMGGGLEVVDRLLDIKGLQIDTFIPEDPSDTKIKAKLDKDFKILGITFSDFNLFIKPKPNLTIEVELSAFVKVQSDNLDFKGKFGITQGQSEMQLALRGAWEDPFGFKGLVIKDAFLGMITGPQNTVAVAGSISFDKDLSIDVAAQFIGSTVPDALIGSFSGEICLLQMIKSFTGYQIPANYLDVCISDLDIYVVANPLGATIGDKHYEPGFRVRGTIEQYGIVAKAEVAIDYEGILLCGEMTPIIIANLLEITGSSPTGGPIVELIARKQEFSFRLNVHLMVLGISQDTNIIINKEGFYFELVGNIFNVFEAKIEAKSSGKLVDGNFYIWATMKDNMVEFMITETKKMLKGSIGGIGTDLGKAKIKKEDLEKAVRWIDNEIEKIEKEFDVYRTKIINDYETARKRADILESDIISKYEDIDDWRGDLAKAIGKLVSWLKKKIREAENQVREWGREFESTIRNRDILKEIRDNLIPPPILETLKGDKITQSDELQKARETLSDLEKLAEKLLKVDDYIDQFGEKAVLNIDSISFEGKLSVVGYGDVELSITGKFMGQPFDTKIQFDFHDLQTGVTKFYEKMLEKVY